MSENIIILVDSGADQPDVIAKEVSRIVGFPAKEAEEPKNYPPNYVIVCNEYSLFIGMSVIRRHPNTAIEDFNPPWDTYPVSIDVVVWSSRLSSEESKIYEARMARELFNKLKTATRWRMMLADDVYEILDQWDPKD